MDISGDQIIPNALEVVDGIVAMVKEAKALKYLWVGTQSENEFEKLWKSFFMWKRN